jgi:tetratricopeptide (TPR) repeat protein
MKFHKFTLKILIICTVFAAAETRAQTKDDWRRVQSKNFQLVGNADEQAMRGAATRLEQFRYVFTQLFPQMKFTSPIPTRVVVFRDKAVFDEFKPVEWAAGYFQPADDMNYIVLPAAGEKAGDFDTVFHEYTHFLIDNSLGRANIPPWFNEGIAEYYEKLLIENDRKVTLGLPNQALLQLLQRTDFIPPETFFGMDYYTLHKQSKPSAQLFYAQSWLLVHYLMHSEGGGRRASLDKFVALLVQGNKPKDAFQRAFEMDYATLETELKKYAAQKSFAETTVELKEKLVFDAQMQTFPVSDSEAKAFQGDLLYHINRLTEAEKVLREALALDAESSIANTALGLVKMRQKKFVDAENYLQKAISGDAQNYFAFFSYAYAISREGTTEFGFASDFSAADAERIRENLRRAIALNPGFAENYNLFAFVNVVRNEQISESIAMINKALEIAPGNQWYAIRLAELYMRKENFGEARNLALKILQTAATDDLRVYAENTVRNINSLEAQLEDIKNFKRREQNDLISEKPLSDEEIARRREKAMLESLNETLRRPRPGEKRLLGYVTNIECQPRQTIFSVKADGRNLQLRSDSLETLKLISFESALVNTDLGCGTIAGESLSVITFRQTPDANAKVAGEIVSIEFVPKNFRFLNENK